MGYASIEQSLYDLLFTIPEVDEKSLSRSDYTILNNGFEKTIVIEYAGINTHPFEAGYTQANLWSINIYIFVRYINDVQVHDSMNELRQSVIDKILEWPTFNNSAVFDANIVSGRPLPPNESDDTINTFWEVLEITAQENQRGTLN